MRKIRLLQIACILFSLSLIACRFSTEWGLIEYLEDKGRPADGSYTLAPVVAYENDGSGEKVLESGMLFYADRTIRLEAPTYTLQSVAVTDVDVYYTLKKYNSLLHYYDTVVCTNESSVAKEYGIKKTSDILKNGLELSYGQYLLEAYAKKTGYTDSEKTTWAFQIGWDTIIVMSIELEGGYRLAYDLDNLNFSETSLNKSEANVITITPHVYKIIKTYEDKSEDLLEVALPSDLGDPEFTLSYKGDGGVAIKGTSWKKNSDGSYSFTIPANELGEDALGTGKVEFIVKNTYKGVAFDGRKDLKISE